MKHLITLAALLLTPLAALAALIFLPAILQAQTLTLKDADTVEAEFRVGGTGKIAVMFKFADGKAQTLLGAVKADTLKRTVEKDGKKTPEMLPMADGWIEFIGRGLEVSISQPPVSQTLHGGSAGGSGEGVGDAARCVAVLGAAGNTCGCCGCGVVDGWAILRSGGE